MKKYIAVIKDDVAGDFRLFGEFPNVGTAEREFKMSCKRSTDAPVSDYSLFILCSYDTNSGAVELNDSDLGYYPTFRVRGDAE